MIQELASKTFQLHNVGIVLLSPFLPRLFSMFKLVENGQFIDDNAQIKAIHLMLYSTHGAINVPDNELKLLKVLVGLDLNALLSLVAEITDNEKETVTIMLNSVIQHWSKIGNTSVEGLRESFLKREGKLEEKEDCYMLDVYSKSYDMLLDSIPWSFGIIRFPWMAKTMKVNWR
ncbi:MAG: hypothetical protein H6Q13_1645 [Bacteroidetes bacterium]|nr:hypothetical protein [Bacteroidota bacterium]